MVGARSHIAVLCCGCYDQTRAAARKQKSPGERRGFSLRDDALRKRATLDGAIDLAEDVADRRSQQAEDDDHHDGDEHQDERVFDETLSAFV